MLKHKILIIEDNKMNLKLARYLLQLDHYEVYEAEDAESGIQLAKIFQPDLIIMDIRLPGMSGLEATKIIKNTEGLDKIYVIALTGLAMRGDEAIAKEAGCDGYMSKPIDIKKFRQYVAKFLHGKSQRAKLNLINGVDNVAKAQNTDCGSRSPYP